MERRDRQQRIRAKAQQIYLATGHYPYNHDELRELVVRLLELMDEVHDG